MAGKSYPDISRASKLRLTGNISLDKSAQDDPLALPDQPCPKCNGEGYIVVRVYPWDGCSYDEKPCDLCNPNHDDFDFDHSGGISAR
jgi:hypothetical protein